MSLLDVILNWVALLLWLRWREAGLLDRNRLAPTGLLSTLQPTHPAASRRYVSLAVLGCLLIVRALFYWHVGAAMNWLPRLHLVATTLSFRSDAWDRMLWYSAFSFLQTFAVFYFWLLLLSAANRHLGDTEPWQKRLRQHLGGLDRLPVFIKLSAPFIIGFLFWASANPLFAFLGLIPASSSWIQLTRQAVVIGLAAFISWKGLLLILCFCCVLNHLVILGNSPLWHYLMISARHILRPLAYLPLRVGRLDVTPVVGIVLVLFLSHWGAKGLDHWFSQIP